MAHITFEGIGSFDDMFFDENVTKVMKDIVNHARPPLVKSYKSSAKSAATGQHYLFGGHPTGEAIEAVKAGNAKKHKDGVYSSTYARGDATPRPWASELKNSVKEPIRNNDKLYFLEYGTGPKGAYGPQDPRPFRDRAVAEASDETLNLMQEKYNEVAVKKK